MSRARDAFRKEKMTARIEAAYADGSLTPDDVKYRYKVKRMIKQGLLPRFNLVKDKDGHIPKYKVKGWKMNPKTKEYEPVMGGAKFIQVSTVDILCKKIPQLKKD